LTSIPGIGLTTAIVVVAETNGFILVENERQLASYAGPDVVQRQSGLSAHATRISRRGNVRLRTALYLPAVSSLRYNPQQIAFYARLRARQPNGKPGVIAVMRKLLVLCYSLWKNDCAYDRAARIGLVGHGQWKVRLHTGCFIRPPQLRNRSKNGLEFL
jgi:transposase